MPAACPVIRVWGATRDDMAARSAIIDHMADPTDIPIEAVSGECPDESDRLHPVRVSGCRSMMRGALIGAVCRLRFEL